MGWKETIGGIIFSFIVSPAVAAGTDFVVISQKINPVMAPKNVGDALQDCANDATCRSLVGAAVTYIGVPPGTVSAAMAAVPKAQRKGEEGFFTIALPPGYQYCRSTISTISVVPATGDRASVMSASSQPHGVDIYTWTPRQNLGGGKSWVEADYVIYGVRDDIAEQQRANGKCRSPGKPLISCRGARGVNKNMPFCGTVSD